MTDAGTCCWGIRLPQSPPGVGTTLPGRTGV